MTRLSQTRKADREQMASQIATIAAKFDAALERPDHHLDPHELLLTIKVPGATVTMGFSPEAELPRGWGYLGHWVCEPGFTFCADFCAHARPHWKATTAADDFEVFAALIQSGLRRAVKGSLFAATPPRERSDVATTDHHGSLPAAA